MHVEVTSNGRLKYEFRSSEPRSLYHNYSNADIGLNNNNGLATKGLACTVSTLPPKNDHQSIA